MKIKLMSLIVLKCFCLLTSCKSSPIFDYKNEPKYVHLSDEVIKKTANALKSEKGLYMIGHGGELMYDVKKLAISFVCNYEINMKEGRELIVYSVHKFLSNINSNEQIRPYLNEFPFQVKDIDIAISFKVREKIKKDSIDFVSIYYGKVFYDISDKEEVLKTIHEETYEEALKIVESEKSTNG
ncbi:MAG: hypothetical protein KR126chlam6_01459 [Candidatus Anoxychlamydiales bacterium]|nr:hypothetical protein [Candidatus Anoxychlamydiales bacterium]